MSNVINLFKKKKKEEEKPEQNQEVLDFFENIKQKNTENEERLRKERLKANKSVLRSYRIKD